MAEFSLYIDITTGNLLAGLNNPLPGNLPKLYLGDTPSLQIYLMTPLANQQSSQFNYSIVPTTGIQLGVFLDNGETGGDQVVYSFYQTFLTDPNNQFFYTNPAVAPGGFPLNTAALAALFAAADTAQVFLDMAIYQNGLQTTFFHQQVTITVGAPEFQVIVQPPLTPLSLQMANTLYWTLLPSAGRGLQLMSPAGKIQQLRLVDQPDGTAQPQWSDLN